MKLKYPVIINKSSSSQVSVFSPDLNTYLSLDQSLVNTYGLIPLIAQKLSAHLKENYPKEIIYPKKIKEYAEINLSHDDIILKVSVDIDIKEKYLSRTLPKLALICRFITISLAAVMSLFAGAISSGENKIKGDVLGASFAITSFIMAMMIYLFSNASKVTAKIGHEIHKVLDKFSCTERQNNIQAPASAFDISTTAKMLKILSFGAIAVLVVTDSVSFGTTSAEAFDGLGNSFSSRYHSDLLAQFIHILAIIMGITAGISGFAFDAGFAMLALAMLDKRINNYFAKNSDNKNINNNDQHIILIDEQLEISQASEETSLLSYSAKTYN